jgi:hypothetical protein
MAWTVLVPLLANLLATTPAQAADPYNVTGTKQIQSVGGKCAGGNPSTLTFTDGPSSVNPLAQQYPAGTFEGQQLNLNNEFIDLFIITNVSPNNKANPAQGAYTANITTKGYELHAGGTPTTVTPGCDLEGPIQIDNKNHIKLADANGNLQPGTATNNAATESTQCYSGDTTTWLVCGIIINTLADSINWILQNVIIPLLNVAPLNTKDPTYPIWSAFRNVASIFFILVFFLTAPLGSGRHSSAVFLVYMHHCYRHWQRFRPWIANACRHGLATGQHHPHVAGIQGDSGIPCPVSRYRRLDHN